LLPPTTPRMAAKQVYPKCCCVLFYQTARRSSLSICRHDNHKPQTISDSH